MSGKDKSDRMKRKLDLGILVCINPSFTHKDINSFVKYKQSMFSILKTKIIILVPDLDICRSWMNISVIIIIVSNSSGKHMDLFRSWFLLWKEYGLWA